MENDLNNKRILFLTTHFFEYEKAIIQQLEKRGAKVDFFDERPSTSLLTKGIIRVAPSLLKFKINRYYQNLLNKTKEIKYDFFLLIKGEATPLFFLQKFKEIHPKTQSIFYAYDSVEEYPKFLKIQSYFNSIFTFEARDAQRFHWHFRPLFFIDEYQKSAKEIKKIDLSFIGSAHTDRYAIGEKIEHEIVRLGLQSFFYYYAPSQFIFYLKRIFDPHFKKFKIAKVKFKSLSHNEVSTIYQQSFAVLDINKPFQLGMSLRPFESLACERKLITTNPEIVHYPFYNPNNILVVDRKNPVIPKAFFQTPFEPLSEEILNKITIDSWIDALLFQNQDDYWKWW